MNDYDEKRDFHRMGIDCPAQFRIQGADEVSDAIVKNLSASGMLLLTSIEIDPGTPLLVHIVPMNSITPPLSATVSVLRSEPAAG
ncbi:MAG: PilZ domain-containing protein, partial [Candidatus Thiodiazotropha sp.]